MGRRGYRALSRAREEALGLEEVRIRDVTAAWDEVRTQWPSFFCLESRFEILTGDLRYVRYNVQRLDKKKRT